MKRLLGILSGILVFILILSSCEGETPNTTNTATVGGSITTTTSMTTPSQTKPPDTTVTTTASVAKTPQYGGSLTNFYAVSPNHWQPGRGVATTNTPFFTNIYQKCFTLMDVKNGPAGTKQWDNNRSYFHMEEYGYSVVESYERPDPVTVIAHVRQGVHFWDKPPVNGRECTADDLIYAITYSQSDPKNVTYRRDETKRYVATKINDYTVKVVVPSGEGGPRVPSLLMSFFIWAPETTDLGLELTNWRNVCGTGPYMLTDYVNEASVTYTRNPKYWEYDYFHPDNRLPYIETLRYIMITDKATQLTAMRTGKIDRGGFNLKDANSLFTTNPELKWIENTPTTAPVIILRNDLPLFKDINIRRALMMAIDYNSMVENLYGGHGEILNFPSGKANGPNYYTSLNELSADQQELFQYKPEKAKQLLTDAGYSQDTEIEILVANLQDSIDVASVIESYWKAIGVKTKIVTADPSVAQKQLQGKSYPYTTLFGVSCINPHNVPFAFYRTGHAQNYGNVVDSYLDTTYDALRKEHENDLVDGLWAKDLKELLNYMLGQVYCINLPTENNFIFFSPYYHGLEEFTQFMEYHWIDQDAKNKAKAKSK